MKKAYMGNKPLHDHAFHSGMPSLSGKSGIHIVKRFLAIVGLLLCTVTAGIAPGVAQASQIELTNNQVFTTWSNINGAVTVIGVSTALDDEWAEEFKAMAPEPVSGKSAADVIAAITQFRAKLDILRADSELDATPVFKHPTRPDDAPSVLYINSGMIMDSLIMLLISLDPLAFVAHYYAWEEVQGKTLDDLYAQIALATKRVDIYMEENGIE